jgi:sialate O-acetylesterase
MITITKSTSMKTKHKLFMLLGLFLVISTAAYSEDLRKIASLSGSWKFSIGDDSNWANPEFNDSEWDHIMVPGNWEDQGYNDYNGYAWYRKKFSLSEIPSGKPIYILLGRIDDADEVFLNGKEIGKSGKFPPEFLTAYDRDRKYIIPDDLLNEKGENVISVKVYDSYMGGGITNGRVGIYTDDDYDLLDLNLSGKWKFHTGNNKDWKSTDFNDDNWTTINVPSVWENEGYEDYDGYAWYRLDFKVPQNLSSGDLYICLGKIDDEDDVYINGEFIGNVDDLRRNTFSRGSGWEYNANRIYKIRDGLLKRNATNTIAVKVYDGQGLGGIYQGPVGIMSAENARKYRNTHQNDNNYSTFWEYMYDVFFGDDNSNND